MQGSERGDREFLDAMELCGELVPVGSVYRFLAEHRRRLFPAEMFGDLFGSGRGRPSIPGSVMVLQALECLSDREAVKRLRCDIRWRPAAGLSLTDSGFHPTVLTLWRARLRASEMPGRILSSTRCAKWSPRLGCWRTGVAGRWTRPFCTTRLLPRTR